ncbi:hypothetical protein BCR32DRAFT_291640 [Anaeromyces robustus]|uniref:Uncharacterized protein n=1 Tax=Anaeromyces robustus TaxID=1754192 RepID=A0A1Y1XEX3_9FUNG|nr:hypothetical protein BCR32DRAFT_291640 [Anaeromyces robustus]|eukprot:ORX83966.1 hypothetical protein BCR32DRAFT_291640 [Anaeromyces robustus]
MAEPRQSRNLVHFLDDDEIESEITFTGDDNELVSNYSLNKNQFKRRKLFNNLDTNNTKKVFDGISPITLTPKISNFNKNNQPSFSVQNTFQNGQHKRKNNSLFSYYNGSDINNNNNIIKNNGYEIDANELFMPAHKSIKIDTNSDAITSPVASSTPIYTSTPLASSTPINQRTSSNTIPVRSSTPILPPSLIKSEGSFSSLSSLSSISKSKNDSNLSSIREDFNSSSSSSSSTSSSNINNDPLLSNSKYNLPSKTSTPISLDKYFLDTLPQENRNLEIMETNNLKDINDIKDIYSTEKLMNSKLIINLPSSVRNKNLFWNLGIGSSDSLFSPFGKEFNDKNSIFSPYRSPILKNEDSLIDSLDYSPTPCRKQKKPEISSNSSNELVLFKPIPWKQPLHDIIDNNTNNDNINSNSNNSNGSGNNIPINSDLMITTDTINDNLSNQNSITNVNSLSNSSSPNSAIITNRLPLLTLDKSPIKSNSNTNNHNNNNNNNNNNSNGNNDITINNDHDNDNNNNIFKNKINTSSSNAKPIPNSSNSHINTFNMSPISPVSPISLSMNLDNSLLTTSNSSPNSRKEIEIPYPQDVPRYYNNISSSSFSTSPSPLTSSAMMNGISRNNTELQSNKNYSRNKSNNLEYNKDLFDYKDDLLSSNLDHHHDNNNDTISTSNIINPINNNTLSNIPSEMNPTQTSCFGTDSMDVDF